ncbi:MAG: DNA recombination protein RmuC [Bacteroidetes bacterium]|nr:DNA recombination protein RmuC [Bacteroidota bacterium]
MTEFIPIISIVISIITLLFLLLIYKKVKQFETKENTEEITASLVNNIDRLDKAIKDDFSRSRSENSESSKSQREELSNSFKMISDQLTTRLDKLTEKSEEKFDKLQEKVSSQLKEIQDNNSQKLEEMRVTVDEKLHSTLEKRLGESFQIVSERLEQVHKGLGEMQNLATGVGDLKRVLTNVKTRGTWGEYQLENLIEQVLAPEQYAKNVATKKGSNDRVEIAIKMPGRNEDKDDVVWLPIDAKFPLEDYQRLVDAQDLANPEMVEAAAKALESRIKLEAKSISTKYLDPPHTTDFAFMFLPIEGLYAEVLRRPGLSDFIQREYRITIAGPTNLLAVMNSLQMGFRTLAIEKRSSDVWKILGEVKTEFGKFGDVLDRTQKKLQEASSVIDTASVRTRAIERKLKDVHELPAGEHIDLLPEGEE